MKKFTRKKIFKPLIALCSLVSVFAIAISSIKTHAFTYDSTTNTLTSENLIDKRNFTTYNAAKLYRNYFWSTDTTREYTLSVNQPCNIGFYNYDLTTAFKSVSNSYSITFRPYSYTSSQYCGFRISGFSDWDSLEIMLNVGSSSIPYEPYGLTYSPTGSSFGNAGVVFNSNVRVGPFIDSSNYDNLKSIYYAGNSISMRSIANSLDTNKRRACIFSLPYYDFNNLYFDVYAEQSFSHDLEFQLASLSSGVIDIPDTEIGSITINLNPGMNYINLSPYIVSQINRNYQLQSYSDLYLYAVYFDFGNESDSVGDVLISESAGRLSFEEGLKVGYDKGLDSLQPLIEEKNSNIQDLTRLYEDLNERYQENFGFKNVFFAMADTPFRAVSNVLNFEVFGVNLWKAVSGILTALLVIWLMKKLV